MANIYGVNPKKLYLCFDTGKHFKCNQVIDYLRGYSTEVNFDLYYVSYVPYHGKTSLDQLFSTVGVVFNGKSNIPEVSDAVRIGNERFKSFDVSNLEFNQKNPTKRQKKIHNVTFHEFQPIQKIRKETQLNIKDITKILFIKFDGDGDLELFSNIRDYNLKTKSKNKIEVKVVESEESKNQKKKLEKEKNQISELGTAEAFLLKNIRKKKTEKDIVKNMKLQLVNRELKVRNIPRYRKNLKLEDKRKLLAKHMSETKELELKKIVILSTEQRKKEKKNKK